MVNDSPLRIALFCHSIISDWNHGNAHFLRGLVRSLQTMGHQVTVLEEEGNWSLSNLLRDHGPTPISEFRRNFPFIDARNYVLNGRAHLVGWLDDLLGQVDICLVHEWNSPYLVQAIGEVASRNGTTALFHDTHHRALTEPERLNGMGLDAYSAVLAYGPVIADIYRQVVDGPEILVFHEGADTELFRPLAGEKTRDVVFIGNWGDEDRNDITRRYFIDTARALPGLSFSLFGVRYPPEVLDALSRAGVHWCGWLPNHRTPQVYAESKMTMHLPRKEYVEVLRGTPTIRVFEALACGIPLISAGWEDDTGMFEAGKDYLAVRTPSQMVDAIRWLSDDPEARETIGSHGRATIVARHTCAHRAAQLIEIVRGIRGR